MNADRGPMTPFQKRLFSLTKEGGGTWSRRGLSLAAGLSQSHVGQYISGTIESPPIQAVAEIAKAASVSPSWLAFGDEGAPFGLEPKAAAIARLRGLLPDPVVVRLLHDRTQRTEVEWIQEALVELRAHGRAAPPPPPTPRPTGADQARGKLDAAKQKAEPRKRNRS